MAVAPISDDSAQNAPRLALAAGAAVLRADAARVALARLDAALLAVLALEGPTSRQRLLHLLWPDEEPENARNALRQRLFRLRRAVGTELVAGGELLSLARGVEHDVDADADGLLLGAHDYADCPAFDQWLDAQRGMIAARRRERDSARLDACERDGRFAEGAALAERLVAADALDEAAVQRLMKLRYLDGQRAAAVAAFERFASALRGDQGGLPSRATTELLATIRSAREPVPVRCAFPASVLRPPRLIGRDGERRRLHAAWSAESVFWLLGEAGLGKTRLIGELVAEAFDAPAETLVVPARPGDAAAPYASLGRALRALIERRPLPLDGAARGELARVLPEIDRAVVAQAGLGQQLMLQGAIESLLLDAHRAGLAALVIDDLHFADSASLEMLQGLVLVDGLAGLRWGFAQRPAEGAAAIEALRAALEEAQRVEVLALGALDEAQMAELIDSLAIDGLDAAKLAPLLTRHTGGNPMYALETIKHLIAGGGVALDASALPRPASVGQLIERRLRQLAPQALQLARVAAVAGVDFSIELAESVLDTRALALADAWRELEAAQVLRGNAFAHDLVHEATLAGVPAPIAAHTHAAVAAWLEAHGGEPARVAAHWLDAGQPRRALAALHAAADAAKRAMRRKEQAAFLDRAAQIESEAGDRDAAFASLRTMIETIWVVDFNAVDATMFERLDAAAATPVQRAVAHALRANWLGDRGEFAEAARLCRSAIELADTAGDEATGAAARQRLADLLDHSGDSAAALALLQPLLPWAAECAGDSERASFYSRLANALDNSSRGREARVYHQRAIDCSRRQGAWGEVVALLVNLSVSWTSAGHMERAIQVLREAMQLAAAHDEARGAAYTLPMQMFKSLRDVARYGEALRWLEPAQSADLGVFTTLLHCHVACCWIHLGQHARAQRELDAAAKAEPPDWMRAKSLQLRGRLKLALGQRPGALFDDALRLVLAQEGRRALRAQIALDHGLTVEPAAALAAARGVIAEGERLDLPGTALAGHIRAARFAADAGLGADAEAHARAALAIGDDVSPYDLYPGERWLVAWRAFQLAGHDDEAADVLRRGVAWVKETMQQQVPEPFRDSFGRANPVNLQLLRAGSAHA